MKSIISLLVVSFLSFDVLAQFPYVAGKEGNGSLFFGGTGRLVNYDFGESRIGFGYSHYHQRDSSRDKDYIGCSKIYKKYRTIGTNVGFAANENTFIVFSEDFKPGVDFSLDFLWGNGKCDDPKSDSVLTTSRFFARLVVSSKQISYLDTLLAQDKSAFEKTKWDVGVNIGHSWGKAIRRRDNMPWFASIGLYLGYSFRDQGILKEKNVQSMIGTPHGGNIIEDTEKRFIGSPKDHLIGKVFIDGGRKLTDLFSSEDKAKSTSALYLIGRIHPELQGADQFKLNGMVGLTLNSYTSVVVGGILLQFDDVTNQSFDKIFSVRLYAGIPINLK